MGSEGRLAETKAPEIVINQGLIESGGEEEIRTRFGIVSFRAKPAQYGLCATLTISIRRYQAL
jgi:hypothetical protein